METKAPDKTKVTGEPQKVELVAGQLTKVTFVNEVDGMGLLELKKVDDQGKPMAVTFELWPVGQVGNGEPDVYKRQGWRSSKSRTGCPR